MSERGIKFAIASTGAVLEGATVRHGSRMPGGQEPWALFGMPIAAMLTRAGIAWIEFVLEEGDGYVYLLVAHETLDKRVSWLRASTEWFAICRTAGFASMARPYVGARLVGGRVGACRPASACVWSTSTRLAWSE
jgi:hypothetical protein